MSYYFSKIINGSFENVIDKATKALAEKGFGILTEIDLKATFKKKLDKDFKNYKILGACNPNFAFQAVNIEDKIGTVLPCNVAVIEQNDNEIEVAIIKPTSMMDPVKNSELDSIASEVNNILESALNNM